jgi:uncharacterized protein YggE
MRIIASIALLLAAMGAAAADGFVTTKGEAKVEVPPDFALLSIHVLAVGSDLEVIKGNVDERTEKVLRAAAAQKIAGADIRSSGIHVEREYETDRNDNEVLKGYKVIREMDIKLRALGSYEEFSQALIDAGIDTLEDIQGGVDDKSALKERAVAAAAKNARTKAQAIASELDITLGSPIEVGEDRLWFNLPLTQRAGDDYREVVVTGSRRIAGTPIASIVFTPHNIEVDATVWVRFAIVSGK